MSTTRDVDHVFCPGCEHEVRLTVTEAHHDGQANLPEGGQVVCLDFGAGCSDRRCPLTGSPGVVMGVRLARSHLHDEAFESVTATCGACGQLAEMEILDDSYAFCPVCGSTSRWVVLDLGSGDQVFVTTD